MMRAERSDLAGHWRDELVALQNGLKELQKQREDFQPQVGLYVSNRGYGQKRKREDLPGSGNRSAIRDSEIGERRFIK